MNFFNDEELRQRMDSAFSRALTESLKGEDFATMVVGLVARTTAATSGAVLSLTDAALTLLADRIEALERDRDSR